MYEYLSGYSQNQLNRLKQAINKELKVRKNKPKRTKVPYTAGGRIRNWTLYVLLLKNNKYYVGITAQKVKSRYEQHASGMGAKWTRLHPPIGILEYEKIGRMTESEAVSIETDKTLELITQHGTEHVRGGSLVIVDDAKLERTYQALLKKRIVIEDIAKKAEEMLADEISLHI
jgi:predicted GIY-YIG superfamily endonuclease